MRCRYFPHPRQRRTEFRSVHAGTLFIESGQTPFGHCSPGGKAEDRNGKKSNASIAIFTSYASIFLPEIFRRATTIRPAMNTASTTKTSIPYNPAADTAEFTSPSLMLNNGTKPPSAVNESCIELTAPQEHRL